MGKLDKQIELQEQIQKMNINLVTCGNCGTIQFVDTKTITVECFACDTELEHCDCPDYFYNGMPEND